MTGNRNYSGCFQLKRICYWKLGVYNAVRRPEHPCRPSRILLPLSHQEGWAFRASVGVGDLRPLPLLDPRVGTLPLSLPQPPLHTCRAGKNLTSAQPKQWGGVGLFFLPNLLSETLYRARTALGFEVKRLVGELAEFGRGECPAAGKP